MKQCSPRTLRPGYIKSAERRATRLQRAAAERRREDEARAVPWRSSAGAGTELQRRGRALCVTRAGTAPGELRVLLALEGKASLTGTCYTFFLSFLLPRVFSPSKQQGAHWRQLQHIFVLIPFLSGWLSCDLGSALERPFLSLLSESPGALYTLSVVCVRVPQIL